MQQIAPDRPVIALAGLISGMQRDLTTATHWFDPDESVASRDVAATLIHGDRILNPGKADKTQDGAPQKKLFLPDDKLLQDRFSKVVGTAFARRDDAAEKAYQAVKAYYVGRASEKGLIAQNAQDIDVATVREAVKATLGNVVDFNGNGHVLAPWGMTGHDFEDHAERVLAQQAKALGIENVSAFGLRNAGADGVYAVMLGNKDLLDDNDNPITISLKPTDPREARGYIDRSGK
jgi:hypothetical protein